MPVGRALDESLALEGVEAVDDGLVGGNLASDLYFSDERRTAVLAQIALDELEDELLFCGQVLPGQIRLLAGGQSHLKILKNITIFYRERQAVFWL